MATYLVDFTAYRPPEELKVDMGNTPGVEQWPMYDEDYNSFIRKVHARSGMAHHGTFLPTNVHPEHTTNPRNDMDAAMAEAQLVMGGAVTELMAKTGLRAHDVDILVTNCSIYCPTPSLASMLINKFKFKPTVLSFHLGGMGCGNGVVAIGLLRDLLKAHPNANALFVPAEITSYCFYAGARKAYLVANTIFRMGGAAVLLSNKRSWRGRAKYALQHAERVHTGQSDAAYNCMAFGPDPDGLTGVHLGRDVPDNAGAALERCLRLLAPRVMTWRQYAEAGAAAASKLLLKRGAGLAGYTPDWTRCADHFAVHAGGYAVLKGIQKGMSLPTGSLLPSFASLRDYGNTSCSTTWYVMAYLESVGAVKRGHTVMQIGLGGGMKAGVNVWRALRDTVTPHAAWGHLGGRPITADELPRPVDEAKAEAAVAAVAANGHGHNGIAAANCAPRQSAAKDAIAASSVDAHVSAPPLAKPAKSAAPAAAAALPVRCGVEAAAIDVAVAPCAGKNVG